MQHTKKKKVEQMGVRIETIKSQQVQVKRALNKILSSEVPKDQCGIELRLAPQMQYDMDTRQNKDLELE